MSFCDNKHLKLIQDVYSAAVISKITVENSNKVKRNGFNRNQIYRFLHSIHYSWCSTLYKGRCKIHKLLFFVSTLTELPKVANCASVNKFQGLSCIRYLHRKSDFIDLSCYLSELLSLRSVQFDTQFV